ncbi:hypothetical protein ADUPG1_008659, partial [Aduncisulcus paluster]
MDLKFLEPGSSPKRAKHLCTFIEKATEKELETVFSKHHSECFDIISETMSELYRAKKETGQKHSTSETINLLPILSILFQQCQPLISRKWQARRIRNTLCELISPNRKLRLRTKAFQVLLDYVDTVGCSQVARELSTGSTISILLHSLGLDTDIIGPLGPGSPANNSSYSCLSVDRSLPFTSIFMTWMATSKDIKVVKEKFYVFCRTLGFIFFPDAVSACGVADELVIDSIEPGWKSTDDGSERCAIPELLFEQIVSTICWWVCCYVSSNEQWSEVEEAAAEVDKVKKVERERRAQEAKRNASGKTTSGSNPQSKNRMANSAGMTTVIVDGKNGRRATVTTSQALSMHGVDKSSMSPGMSGSPTTTSSSVDLSLSVWKNGLDKMFTIHNKPEWMTFLLAYSRHSSNRSVVTGSSLKDTEKDNIAHLGRQWRRMSISWIRKLCDMPLIKDKKTPVFGNHAYTPGESTAGAFFLTDPCGCSFLLSLLSQCLRDLNPASPCYSTCVNTLDAIVLMINYEVYREGVKKRRASTFNAAGRSTRLSSRPGQFGGAGKKKRGLGVGSSSSPMHHRGSKMGSSGAIEMKPRIAVTYGSPSCANPPLPSPHYVGSECMYVDEMGKKTKKRVVEPLFGLNTSSLVVIPAYVCSCKLSLLHSLFFLLSLTPGATAREGSRITIQGSVKGKDHSGSSSGSAISGSMVNAASTSNPILPLTLIILFRFDMLASLPLHVTSAIVLSVCCTRVCHLVSGDGGYDYAHYLKKKEELAAQEAFEKKREKKKKLDQQTEIKEKIDKDNTTGKGRRRGGKDNSISDSISKGSIRPHLSPSSSTSSLASMVVPRPQPSLGLSSPNHTPIFSFPSGFREHTIRLTLTLPIRLSLCLPQLWDTLVRMIKVREDDIAVVKAWTWSIGMVCKGIGGKREGKIKAIMAGDSSQQGENEHHESYIWTSDIKEDCLRYGSGDDSDAKGTGQSKRRSSRDMSMIKVREDDIAVVKAWTWSIGMVCKGIGGKREGKIKAIMAGDSSQQGENEHHESYIWTSDIKEDCLRYGSGDDSDAKGTGQSKRRSSRDMSFGSVLPVPTAGRSNRQNSPRSRLAQNSAHVSSGGDSDDDSGSYLAIHRGVLEMFKGVASSREHSRLPLVVERIEDESTVGKKWWNRAKKKKTAQYVPLSHVISGVYSMCEAVPFHDSLGHSTGDVTSVAHGAPSSLQHSSSSEFTGYTDRELHDIRGVLCGCTYGKKTRTSTESGECVRFISAEDYERSVGQWKGEETIEELVEDEALLTRMGVRVNDDSVFTFTATWLTRSMSPSPSSSLDESDSSSIPSPPARNPPPPPSDKLSLSDIPSSSSPQSHLSLTLPLSSNAPLSSSSLASPPSPAKAMISQGDEGGTDGGSTSTMFTSPFSSLCIGLGGSIEIQRFPSLCFLLFTLTSLVKPIYSSVTSTSVSEVKHPIAKSCILSFVSSVLTSCGVSPACIFSYLGKEMHQVAVWGGEVACESGAPFSATSANKNEMLFLSSALGASAMMRCASESVQCTKKVVPNSNCADSDLLSPKETSASSAEGSGNGLLVKYGDSDLTPEHVAMLVDAIRNVWLVVERDEEHKREKEEREEEGQGGARVGGIHTDHRGSIPSGLESTSSSATNSLSNLHVSSSTFFSLPSHVRVLSLFSLLSSAVQLLSLDMSSLLSLIYPLHSAALCVLEDVQLMHHINGTRRKKAISFSASKKKNTKSKPGIPGVEGVRRDSDISLPAFSSVSGVSGHHISSHDAQEIVDSYKILSDVEYYYLILCAAGVETIVLGRCLSMPLLHSVAFSHHDSYADICVSSIKVACHIMV